LDIEEVFDLIVNLSRFLFKFLLIFLTQQMKYGFIDIEIY